jgi:hypothetical protein
VEVQAVTHWAGSSIVMGHAMMVYAKALLVGLCAAAVVLGVCWRVGLIPHVEYTLPSVSHPSPVAPSSADYAVMIKTEDVTKVTVTTTPWYLIAAAGLALVTASGWQLRRSWRDRRSVL